MLQRPVLFKASKVSLVVGSCLNLINQGGALFRMEGIDWMRLCLNFAVPFLVSAYSAGSIRLRTER